MIQSTFGNPVIEAELLDEYLTSSKSVHALHKLFRTLPEIRLSVSLPIMDLVPEIQSREYIDKLRNENTTKDMKLVRQTIVKTKISPRFQVLKSGVKACVLAMMRKLICPHLSNTRLTMQDSEEDIKM